MPHVVVDQQIGTHTWRLRARTGTGGAGGQRSQLYARRPAINVGDGRSHLIVGHRGTQTLEHLGPLGR